MQARWLISLSMIALLTGCQMGTATAPQPRPTAGQVKVEQESRAQSLAGAVPVEWVWPCEHPDQCQFLGNRILRVADTETVVRALDREGHALWEFPLESGVADIVVNSERQEALILTFKDSHRIDLRDGSRLGPGPAPVSVFEDGVVHGTLTWKGDYVVRSVLHIVGPVDPKAPGRSPQFFKHWLLHLDRDRGGWEDLGLLFDKGSGSVSMSEDGRTILLNEDSKSGARVFRDGKPYAVFDSKNGQRVEFYLSDKGDYVAEWSPGTLDLYTVEGQVIWQRLEQGFPAVIHSDLGDLRIVLRYENSYTIIDRRGEPVASGDGRVSSFVRHHQRHVLVERGTEIRLIDLAGRTIATYPAVKDAVWTSSDGKWVVVRGDHKLSAYPVPAH